MNYLLLISMACLSAAASAGCGGNVVVGNDHGGGGGGGSGGSGGSTGTTTTSTTAPVCNGAGAPLAVQSSVALSDAGNGWLNIFLSTGAGSCDDPLGFPADCSPVHAINLLLTPDAQAPGTYVVGPDSNTVFGYFDEQGSPDPSTCMGGTGEFNATLVITSIDSTHVAGAICDNPEWHGTFDASMCGCLGTGAACTADSQCCLNYCNPMNHVCDP